VKVETKVFLLSMIGGVLCWVIDGILDYLVFCEGAFWELMITRVPAVKLYFRSVVFFLFVGFGFVISVIVARGRRAEEMTG